MIGNLSLSWSGHHDTVVSFLQTFRLNDSLVDCTIAAEGKYLKAHKVVLSACSPYFQLLFNQENDKNPIVILKDVQYEFLKLVIDFMYYGEVQVHETHLNTFLEVARSLQIKGLDSSHKEVAKRSFSTNSKTSRSASRSMKCGSSDQAKDNVCGYKVVQIVDSTDKVSVPEQSPSPSQSRAEIVNTITIESAYSMAASTSATPSNDDLANAETLKWPPGSTSSSISNLTNEVQKTNPLKCDSYDEIYLIEDSDLTESESETRNNGVQSTDRRRGRQRELQQKELKRCQKSILDGGSGAPISSECIQRLEQPSTLSSCRMDLESGPIDAESNDDSIDIRDDNAENHTSNGRLHQKELERCQNSILDGESGAPITNSKCIQRLEQPSTLSSCRMDLESGAIDAESNDDSIDMRDDNTETRTNGSFESDEQQMEEGANNVDVSADCDGDSDSSGKGRQFGSVVPVITSVKCQSDPEHELHRSLRRVRQSGRQAATLLGSETASTRAKETTQASSNDTLEVMEHKITMQSLTEAQPTPPRTRINPDAFSRVLSVVLTKTEIPSSLLLNNEPSPSRSRRKHGSKTLQGKVYACPECNKEFTKPSYVVIHRRKHTGEKPYTCPVCNKCFGFPSALKRHSRLHTGERPYKCKYCLKTFSTASTHKVHMRMHTGERPYVCRECGKAFASGSHLTKHKSVHMEGNFKCDTCGMGFKHRYLLKQHLYVVHDRGQATSSAVSSKQSS